MELGVAFVFAGISWLVGSPPRDYQFFWRWIGRSRYGLVLLLSLAANLATAVLGWVVVDFLDWPDSNTPAFWRGITMAGIGQAAVRVQFTRLPTVGSGITLLGTILDWVHELRDLFVENRVDGFFSDKSSKQLAEAAATAIASFANDASVEEPVRKQVTDQLTEKVQALGDKTQRAQAESDLRSFLVVTVSKYKILRRTFEQ